METQLSLSLAFIRDERFRNFRTPVNKESMDCFGALNRFFV